MSLKKSRNTRAEVLAAAAKCFREKGYAAVSLRDIAKTAGLTTGSVYYHFGSKEDVVGEVLDQGHIHIRLKVEDALSDCEMTEQHAVIIRRALKTHIMCLFGDDSLPSANIRIFSQVPQALKTNSLASRHQYENLWVSLLTRAQEAGWLRAELDPKIVMRLMFGAINWTIEWANSDEESVDLVVDQVVTLLRA